MSSASSSETSIELVRCYCTVPAALQTSWTSQNPGRRFFTCKFYNPEMQFRGCNFFKWKVINFLVMEKMSLKQEISEIKIKCDENRRRREIIGKRRWKQRRQWRMSSERRQWRMSSVTVERKFEER
ncbi:hypothetical protein RND81_04G132700 [Saponaria officinalis]|uniref:GRF-type domain-containing protein n=1 Tax=Saponaria officinalis TaxID=3572 RepID=A0AAW1LKS9_SAPOF